jgi:hypothetical protein
VERDPRAPGCATLLERNGDAVGFLPTCTSESLRLTGPRPKSCRGRHECTERAMPNVRSSRDCCVDLRDVQVADARIITMRHDRARKNLDRHPNYILAAYMAHGTWNIDRALELRAPKSWMRSAVRRARRDECESGIPAGSPSTSRRGQVGNGHPGDLKEPGNQRVRVPHVPR